MALAWARVHWRGLAVAAAVVVSFGGGWLLRPPSPAPAVQASQRIDLAELQLREGWSRLQAGPVDRTITRYRPRTPALSTSAAQGDSAAAGSSGAAPAPAVNQPCDVAEVVQEHYGPRIEEHGEREVAQGEEHAQAQLQVTPPAPLPRWSVGLGVDDPFGARELRGIGGVRLVGEQHQLWLDVSFAPARGLAGLSGAVRITFP